MKTIVITIADLANLLINTASIHKGTILENAFDIEAIEEGDYYSITEYMLGCHHWDYIASLQRNPEVHYVTFDPETLTFGISIAEGLASMPSPKVLFQHLYDFSNWVNRSYRHELYPWETNAWDIGICQSGYMDVTIALLGGYMDVTIALLEAYMAVHYFPLFIPTYFI